MNTFLHTSVTYQNITKYIIIASRVSTTKCPSAGDRLSEIVNISKHDTAESREVGLQK